MWKRHVRLLLAFVATLPAACERTAEVEPAPPKEILAAQPFRLSNGLSVELLTGPCGDNAALALLFAVGADHDPPGRSGMAHLIERLWSSEAGGERVVAMSGDHTLYSVAFEAGALSEELDALAARMTAPELTEAALERARAQVLEDIASRRGGDAAKMAVSYAAESVRPSRGGGWRGGIAEEVEAIGLAEVQAFWRAHFTPVNARLIVVGEVDPARARQHVEAALGRIADGSAAAPRDPANATVTGTLVMGDAPSAVAVAVPAPAPADPLYPAFLVLAARLLAEPTEPRSWEVRYDPIAQPELLFVTGASEPAERPEAAAARIRREMTAQLRGPLGPGDLAAVRDRFGVFLGFHDIDPASCRRDARALAAARARRAQLGLAEHPLGQALRATTQDQLDEAIERFSPRRTAAVIAGGTIR